MSRTLLEEAWIKLDACVAELSETHYDPEEKARMKGVCRGMAEVLALFMKPHFTTADEIAGEAVKRYKAKKNGEHDYETPGIGGRRFTPPPGTSAAPRAVVPPKPKHKLGDKETQAIKFAMQSGMFKAADLAKSLRRQ